MQILGLGKVRIMRFSGRKVGLRVFCRDQIPTQGTKKSGKYYLPVKEERGKREQGVGKLKKGNKAGENCRKYATEMKNEKAPSGSTKGGENIRAMMREKCTEEKKQNKAEIGKICIFLGFCLHICKKNCIFAADFA